MSVPLEVFCEWKGLCQIGMYIGVGGIIWALLCLLLTLIFAIQAFGTAKHVFTVADQMSAGVSMTRPVATATAHAVMPMATATAVAVPMGKTPEI